MFSSRFMPKARSIFGSNLLSMSENNIKRFCSSGKFHSSLKKHHTIAKDMNMLTIQNNLVV